MKRTVWSRETARDRSVGQWQSSTTAMFEATAIVIERRTSYLL